MSAIDFRDVRGVGRDCPHPGCGVTIEVSLAQSPLSDPGREFRCRACKAIIPWQELQSIKELLETIEKLGRGMLHFRLLCDSVPDTQAEAAGQPNSEQERLP